MRRSTPGGAAERAAGAPTKPAAVAVTMGDDPYVVSERKGASMTRSKPLGLLSAAVLVPLVALVAAGCGSSGGTSTATAKAPSGSSATVSVANTGLGNILVDSQGRTLYLFQKDSGTKSTCFGGCATAWPPLRANGKPTAGGGAKASLLGTTPRSDGKPQVTYDGHPLYGYQGDSSAGDTNGQGINGFGAPWYVLAPSGNAITTASSSSGGGNGY
jgi:predicted lipoprotein with Yx(FWY)xxD motif